MTPRKRELFAIILCCVLSACSKRAPPEAAPSLVAVTGYHRKHSIRLLNMAAAPRRNRAAVIEPSHRSYALRRIGVGELDDHWSLQIAARVADALLAALSDESLQVTPASFAPSTIWITTDRRVVFYGFGPRLAPASSAPSDAAAEVAIGPAFIALLLRLFERVPEHARMPSFRFARLAFGVGPCVARQLKRSLSAPDHPRARLRWWRSRLSVVHALPTVRSWAFTPLATLVLCASAGAIVAGAPGVLAGIGLFPAALGFYLIFWPEWLAGLRKDRDFGHLRQAMLERPEADGTD